MSEFGTKRTSRAGLLMSVDRGTNGPSSHAAGRLSLTQSGHQPQRQHRALVSRPPVQFSGRTGGPCSSLIVPAIATWSNVASEEMWYRQNRAAFPLEPHSSPSALRAGRMDRSGRPEGGNDIVEQYRNPSKELALLRAP